MEKKWLLVCFAESVHLALSANAADDAGDSHFLDGPTEKEFLGTPGNQALQGERRLMDVLFNRRKDPNKTKLFEALENKFAILSKTKLDPWLKEVEFERQLKNWLASGENPGDLDMRNPEAPRELERGEPCPGIFEVKKKKELFNLEPSEPAPGAIDKKVREQVEPSILEQSGTDIRAAQLGFQLDKARPSNFLALQINDATEKILEVSRKHGSPCPEVLNVNNITSRFRIFAETQLRHALQQVLEKRPKDFVEAFKRGGFDSVDVGAENLGTLEFETVVQNECGQVWKACRVTTELYPFHTVVLRRTQTISVLQCKYWKYCQTLDWVFYEDHFDESRINAAILTFAQKMDKKKNKMKKKKV